jgi:hypothetical protein
MRKKQSTAVKIDGKGVPEAALARVRGGQATNASGHGQAPPKPGDTHWHVSISPHGTRWHVAIRPGG